MANVRTLDFKLIDELFEMQQGYVMDFSNNSLARFFVEELSVDLYNPSYATDGESKARRLRCYLRTVDTQAALTALKALWSYRAARQRDRRLGESIPNAEGRFLEVLGRIEGTAGAAAVSASPQAPVQAVLAPRLQELKVQLLDLASLAPQPRGYAFEKFLIALFEVYQLEPKEPFRLRGEQIDGSFEFANQHYLIEAKWQNEPTSQADLHVFHGKIEQKAAWTRGLFVSHSGFTEDGLSAFGRGKRLICMEGLDIYDALSREIPLTEVLKRKIRKASDTGYPFHRVRDLF